MAAPNAEATPVAVGALHGVRVLDFTRILAGPLATMILADLGADVVKIEQPDGGDSYRHTGSVRIGGTGVNYLSVNRNKRGITLDVTRGEGWALLERLAADADVIVENFRPHVAQKLGLTYPALRALNERIVHCSITGFGHSGPYRDLPAVDPIVQAMSGLMDQTGEPDGRAVRIGTAVGDIYGAQMAVAGILAALLARASTGHGQHVAVSLLDAALFGLIPREGEYFATGTPPTRCGDGHPAIAPFQTYATKDRPLYIAVFTDRTWAKLCEALGVPELAHDPRFADNAARLANRDALTELLEEALRSDSAESWLWRLGQAGVPAAPVNDVAEALSSPHVEAAGIVQAIRDGAGRTLRTIANPLRLSLTPAAVRTPPPALGEHNEEIYGELGLGTDDLAHLRSRGVI